MLDFKHVYARHGRMGGNITVHIRGKVSVAQMGLAGSVQPRAGVPGVHTYTASWVKPLLAVFQCMKAHRGS